MKHIHIILSLTALLFLLPELPLHGQATGFNVSIRGIDLSAFPSVLLRVQIHKPLNSNIDVNAGNAAVSENGIPQNVEYFECPQDSSMRLSIAVLLDRSLSMTRDARDQFDPDSTKIRAAKAAVATFLDLLGPRDEAAIFSFNAVGNRILTPVFTVEHDFSTDIASLKASLVSIAAEGGTRLWDAIIKAVDRLRVRPGRKSLIVLSDGLNRGENFLRNQAIQSAVSEGIPVYPIGLGDDVDVGELTNLANATGGRFYRAPDAADLEAIFNQLGSEIIADECVLRYTSSNVCLDGSRRNVLLSLSGLGFFGEADTSYTVQRSLNPATLVVEPDLTVSSQDTAVVPVNLLEQFSTLQPLTCVTTINYDPSLMRFLDVLTDGTMSEGSVADVTEPVRGELRIELQSFLPAMPTGPLFRLRFIADALSEDSSTAIGITHAELNGVCPFEPSTQDGSLLIHACEEQFTFGIGDTRVVSDGEEVVLPVTIAPAPNPGRPLQLRFLIDKPDSTLEYLGVSAEHTLAASADLLVQDRGALIDIFFSTESPAAGDTLFLLHFRAHAGKEPRQHTLSFSIPETFTGCRVIGEMLPSRIIVDGICQPVVRRIEPAVELFNYPNPVTGGTVFAFTLPEEANVQLLLLDAGGRSVRTLLDARIAAGSYEHRFDGSDMPAGEYLAVLRTGKTTSVRRVLILR